MATEPILDLSTLIPERPVIRIDGETYHLRSADELTLAESHQFTKWGKELEALAVAGEAARLEALLVTVSAAVMADVPPEVASRLRTPQRLAIVEVFTLLLLRHRAQAAGAAGSALSQSTGRKPSPASSMPSGASPTGGSTAHPPHSSGPT